MQRTKEAELDTVAGYVDEAMKALDPVMRALAAAAGHARAFDVDGADVAEQQLRRCQVIDDALYDWMSPPEDRSP